MSWWQWVMGNAVHDGKANEMGGVPSGGDHGRSSWRMLYI